MNISIISALCIFLIALIAFVFSLFLIRRVRAKRAKRPHFNLRRYHINPIISPLNIREWELGGTFNPAAFKDDRGRVHLLYRAIGADGISRVGHASSADGLHFDERSMYPIFEPLPGQGMPDGDKVYGPKHYDPSFYTSGGGWGGSEDPRTVKIGDTVYMNYVAFEGWESVRIALTSLKSRDLDKRQWKWKRPALISAPGTVNKNWVIFPEKVNGRFAILTSISPNIMIEYVDSLETFGNANFLQSKPPKGGRKGFWDNWVRGAGPPPLRTHKGWLLLYHAMDRSDPNKYKVGAMLLDLKDPTKILYRSPQPILSPDAHYENDGKPGVVYASGAVIKGNDLLVYYGGGDRHVCIAQTPLDELLGWLTEYGEV